MADEPRAPARIWLLGAVMLLCAGVGATAVLCGGLDARLLQRLVARSGAAGMLTYVVGVVLLELLWMPRLWGLLAGGVLFGPLHGALLSVVGDLLGGALCFGIARATAGAWVFQRLAQRPRARQVVQLLARKRGVASVALLRVCPVAHYTLVSYAAGMCGVPTGSFLLGTGIGLLPAAVVYPLLGDAALRPGSPVFVVSLALVLVFLAVTLLVARRMLRQ